RPFPDPVLDKHMGGNGIVDGLYPRADHGGVSPRYSGPDPRAKIMGVTYPPAHGPKDTVPFGIAGMHAHIGQYACPVRFLEMFFHPHMDMAVDQSRNHVFALAIDQGI